MLSDTVMVLKTMAFTASVARGFGEEALNFPGVVFCLGFRSRGCVGGRGLFGGMEWDACLIELHL